MKARMDNKMEAEGLKGHIENWARGYRFGVRGLG